MNEYPAWEPKREPTVNVGLERRNLAFSALGVTLILILAELLQFALVEVANRFAPQWVETEWFYWCASALPMYAFSMPLSLFLFREVPVVKGERKRISFLTWCGILFICFFCSYAGNCVSNLINGAISYLSGREMPDVVGTMTENSSFWYNFVFLGLLAPIMEELFFRKVVIDRLRVYGDLPAILITGITFGLIHGNVGQCIYASLIGIVLGYVYLRTGNIRYTVLIHIVINQVGGVYAAEMLKRLDLEALAAGKMDAFFLRENMTGILMLLAYLCFLGVVFICGIVAMALLFPRIRFEKGEHRMTGREWLRAGVLNPGTLLLFATVVYRFISFL